MDKILLNVGDTIEYLQKTSPRMDNSHLIPIKCEVLSTDNGFYKLSDGMTHQSKYFQERLKSVNGVSINEI